MRDLRVLGLKTPQSRGDRDGHMHVTARCGPALEQLVGAVEACDTPELGGFWRWRLARVRAPGDNVDGGVADRFDTAVEALGNALARWGEP